MSAIGGAACADEDSSHACNITSPNHVCVEWSPGDARDSLTCSQLGGTLTNACPRAGLVAGCRKDSPDGSGFETTWVYDDTQTITVDPADCEGQFLTP
jgi:hypothetical protein